MAVRRGVCRPAVAVGLGLVFWLSACMGAGPAAGADRVAPAARSNQVAGVTPFPLDLDSGSMALHAASSLLSAYGRPSSYARIEALSGACFKFVYDTTEAYEPLRDLFPIDVLKAASRAADLADAHWEMDLPIAAVKDLVKREIDKGHPVIAPFLKPDAYHGFFLIVGYDFDAGVFYLQGALRDSVYARVPIPDQWNGPTASPMGWAANPVFVGGDYLENRQEDAGLDKATVVTGIDLLRGGELTYGVHAGEQAYMASPGPHKAAFGIPAYRLLAWDVAKAPIVVEREGSEEANFGLLWRLDAQLSQLEQDRTYAADALDYLASRVSGGKSIDVEAIATNMDRTAGEAAALRKVFWDTVPYEIKTVDGIVRYVGDSGAIVLSFAGRDRLIEDLRARGLKALKTRWGPAIVADSPEKRLKARTLVRSLESRERASLAMMEQVVSYIGPDLGITPPETTGPARRRRK
ncbi:MAG: hypothetical protein WAW06_04910 [bacterium]